MSKGLCEPPGAPGKPLGRAARLESYERFLRVARLWGALRVMGGHLEL
jgi:hypothetical protein